eukprot:768293-Hanusia_phi.AAC.6
MTGVSSAEEGLKKELRGCGGSAAGEVASQDQTGEVDHRHAQWDHNFARDGPRAQLVLMSLSNFLELLSCYVTDATLSMIHCLLTLCTSLSCAPSADDLNAKSFRRGISVLVGGISTISALFVLLKLHKSSKGPRQE